MPPPPGDLILIAPGTYHEAVDVETDDLTIRGLDRDEVDPRRRVRARQRHPRARRERGRGREPDGAELHHQRLLLDRRRRATGRRTSRPIRTGDYGIYAFDSINGPDRSLVHRPGVTTPASTSASATRATPCIDDVLSEHNGLGYSGTNCRWQPADRQLGLPQQPGRDRAQLGQLRAVLSRARDDHRRQPRVLQQPARHAGDRRGDARPWATGSSSPAGSATSSSATSVCDHDIDGIGLVPFVEDDANDDLPTQDEWTTAVRRDQGRRSRSSIPATICRGTSFENRVIDNVVSDSRVGDLAVALGTAPTCRRSATASPATTFTTSAPLDLESAGAVRRRPAAAATGRSTPVDLGRGRRPASARRAVDYAGGARCPSSALEDMPDAGRRRRPGRPPTSRSSVDLDCDRPSPTSPNG